MKKIGAIQSLHQTNMGVSHTYSSLCRDDLSKVDYINFVPSSEVYAKKNNFIECVPKKIRWPIYKFNLAKWATEKKLLKELNNLDMVYIWPEVSLSTINKIKGKLPIVIERVNCFTGKAKKILDEEFNRNGLKSKHNITDDLVHYEKKLIDVVDYIFCPSDEVKKSFLEEGVPEKKILNASYGWCGKRFDAENILTNKTEKEYDFVFVGRICIRKGSHLLIKYFAESGVKKKLLLCGKIEQDIIDVCGKYLELDNIHHMEFTQNVSEVYKKSRIFVFPTLEEGDPLVTYEAMLHGLPILTTRMGAGSVVRNNIDGWVIDAHCKEQWINKFRELSDNLDDLEKDFYTYKERMNYFEFKRVAERRAEIMHDVF